MEKLKSFQIKILSIIEDYQRKNKRQPCQIDIAIEAGVNKQKISYYIKKLKKKKYIKIERINNRRQYITILNKSWRKDIPKLKID